MIKNKKGVSIAVIAGILLIIIILVSILYGLISTNKDLRKIFKDLFDFGEEEQDYGIINNKAKKAFNLTFQDIEKCRKSKDNDCACEVNLANYDKIHALKTDGSKIYLLNIKDNNEITMEHQNFNSLNCYAFTGILSTKNILTHKLEQKNFIKFDKEKPYIEGLGLFTSADFNYRFNIYKTKNELCWLTDEADEDTVNNIKKCQ